MKKLLFVLLIFAFFSCHVFAASDGHGLETSPVSTEDWTNILENINLTLIREEPLTHEIACFDVSGRGLIALGFNTSPKKTILIYDVTGEFLYGYSFSSSGSIGIAFIDDNLAIYFARSNLVATYTPAGQCVSLENVLHTKSNSAPKERMMYSTRKQMNNVVYRLERDFGFSAQSYSRLVTRDEHGTEIILYDVTMEHSIGQIVLGVLAVGFITCVIWLTIKHVKVNENDS